MSSSQHHFGHSQIPVNPSFRNAAVNAVAVVPLLSQDASKTTASSRSFQDLMAALRRHGSSTTTASATDHLLLTVPNSSLTRPGDWKYSDTPLKAFHWQYGCQRLLVFDGRPQHSRYSQDRLLNAATRDWIDLCPSRRTAAVIGVLNMHDCQSIADLHTAEHELHQYAVRFSTPPFAVTQHGASFDRDCPVQRLFVYDSFDEESQKINLGQSSMSASSILAFPPSDEAHAQMMDLHYNMVISDLAVAIFRSLEQKIRETTSGSIPQQQPQQARPRGLSRFVSSGSGAEGSGGLEDETPVNQSSRNLGISQMAGLVSPESKLAKDSPTNTRSSSSGGTTSSSATTSFFNSTVTDSSALGNKEATTHSSSKLPQLLTPLDVDSIAGQQDVSSSSSSNNLPAKDVEALRKRDTGRREKLAADLCLLAGSPLDAYERYLKAAELCKTGASLDPLWYASALEGCAAAHIAMAEAGGYSTDEYLENNFQLPEEIMALAVEDAAKRQASASNPSKQTLPEVVFALCEESLNIINRHEKLGHLYAELLLKLAVYCADAAESHLRCRWGEGAGCYSGEAGDLPRWEKTSIHKMKFQPLKTKEGGDMIAINTQNRVKKVCELLAMAVSVGSLDLATRVDVAICSARLCLDGVKPTLWKGKLPDPIKLPRKAAYFTVVAAETVSAARGREKEQTSSDLWLLATQLYSRKGNPADGGGSYGWATLRAFCFDCLSIQGSGSLSLEAAGQLLSLLTELDPDIPFRSGNSSRLSKNADESKRVEGQARDEIKHEAVPQGPPLKETSSGRVSARVSLTLDDENLQEAINSASQFAKNLRASYTNFTGASHYIAQQSKWADDDPIPSVDVPFSDLSPFLPSIITLNLVWPKMRYEICSAAQRRCLDRMAALRRAIPTSSSSNKDGLYIFGFYGQEMPLYVSSAAAIQSEPCLELDCVQKRVVSDESKQGAMATFYNPYANKKSDKMPTTRVAEEEERAMLLSFGNRLSLPLEVQRSELVFNNDCNGRVKAAALSFTIPPKAKRFTVHFPFTVMSSVAEDVDGDTFEVKGLDLTCFGRSFFLPIKTLNGAPGLPLSRNIPEFASMYPHRADKSKSGDSADVKPRIETYPCQPRLQVFFLETGAPAETIAISLSDGEIFSVPTLSLNNYLGPSSKGKIECLEILAVGLPGAPSRKLFDSTSALTSDESEGDFVHDLLFEANPPPLKIRTVNCSLKLDGINGYRRNEGNESNVAFQIAAAHNMGEKIYEGTTITLQFRYRGVCNVEREVWRKREVALRIVHTKGPRISSIAFRPDLVKESAFAELSKSCDTKKKFGHDKVAVREAASDVTADSGFVVNRVGMDSEVSVCSKESYFVLTVANETRSVLTLTRQNEPVGGFVGYPLNEMAVRPGVSAKIPIVMNRIARVDENGNPVDVFSELIAKTSIIWESHKGGEAGPVKGRGHIRIPPACLREIVNRHPSFISQICQPPCFISLFVGEKVHANSSVTVSLGKPISVEMEVALESWLPKDVIENCTLALEFRCARKGSRESDNSSLHREYFWAGKLRRKLQMKDSGDNKHCAKLVFCRPGQFAVSACARIARTSPNKSDEGTEEIWWAPFAQTVVVEETKVPAQ